MGTETCILAMGKKKVKLLILDTEISENTKEKLTRAAVKNNIQYRFYNDTESLAQSAGSPGRCVFGIIDDNFADVILKEIDNEN